MAEEKESNKASIYYHGRFLEGKKNRKRRKMKNWKNEQTRE